MIFCIRVLDQEKYISIQNVGQGTRGRRVSSDPLSAWTAQTARTVRRNRPNGLNCVPESPEEALRAASSHKRCPRGGPRDDFKGFGRDSGMPEPRFSWFSCRKCCTFLNIIFSVPGGDFHLILVASG